MRTVTRLLLVMSFLFGFMWAVAAFAEVNVQCPCYQLDAVGRADPTTPVVVGGNVLSFTRNNADGNDECLIRDAHNVVHDYVCKQLAAGDGHVYMADRDRSCDPTVSNCPNGDLYTFGFSDVTGVASEDVMDTGMLASNTPGPTIVAKEGQEMFLSLTNVGMHERPDLFDPHTVHNHGFPNAGPIFDGEPMASVGIHMGSTFTYYYKWVEPGTYMYHCHVEAAEHMQMGMLANLFVRPAQDDNSVLKSFGGYAGFAYNDGDVSTGYHVAYPLQLTGFDPKFHHADHTYNKVDFAAMDDTYLCFNGRGYPDTVDVNPIANVYDHVSQSIPSLITAAQGQKILLRISSLVTTDFFTILSPGIPMRVVGQGARQLRATTGANNYYLTNSVTLGGGEANDVILDTTNVLPGTYFVYTANLHHLANDKEDFGGAMTEIHVQ